MSEVEIITGNTNAAQFLGCSPRTIERMQKRGDFPTPINEIKTSRHSIRQWTKAQLEEVKNKMKKQGRPKVQ